MNGIIYNIHKLLETELPTEKIYANTFESVNPAVSVPDRLILVKESGGTKQAWTEYTNQSITVMSRDIDPVVSRELAYDVYQTLNNRFGLILPSVTVNGELYPAKQVAQISAETTPQSLGSNGSGLYEWVINFRIILTED